MPRAKSTASYEERRHIRRQFRLLESPAYIGLSPNARVLLEQLQMLENGRNNGALYLSVSDAVIRMGINDRHAGMRAFDELQAHGLIVPTNAAAFNVKTGTGRARCWRLTWLSCDGASPTDDFLQFKPEPGSPAERRIARLAETPGGDFLRGWISTQAGAENAPMVAKLAKGGSKTGRNSTPQELQKSQNHGKSASCNSSDSTPHCKADHGLGVVETFTCNPEGLRQSIIEFLADAGYGHQGFLAARTGISPSKLSRFLKNRPGGRKLSPAEIAGLSNVLTARAPDRTAVEVHNRASPAKVIRDTAADVEPPQGRQLPRAVRREPHQRGER